MDYTNALSAAIRAAQAAGACLREEFHHPGGPRGEGGYAPSEAQAEQLIRDELADAFPAWSYRGRTIGFRAGDDSSHAWLVDSNVGTRAFLRGFRGTGVSIALLRDGLPVLGVVYTFAAPDDRGDLFAWAEGCGPLTRNGRPVRRQPWPLALARETVVLVSEDADNNSAGNAKCVAPGRFRTVASIAYRLALVAAGEADAGLSLNAPAACDYAAGHALLRSVGGVLLDERGQPVVYSKDGHSQTRFCFGGAPAVVRELVRRPWNYVFARPQPSRTDTLMPFGLVRLEPGRTVTDSGLLQRAQGCLLGQLAGDALGSAVEFQSGEQIRQKYPDGIRVLRHGGPWKTIAGQPTDDSELALTLARSIVAQGGYDRETVARAYVAWYRSQPFDVGNATRQALGAATDDDIHTGQTATALQRAASQTSQANGSLMRISPLGIWGYRLPADQLAEYARADSALTHPNPVCQEACAVFAVAVAQAIATGLDIKSLYEHTMRWAERACRSEIVIEVLQQAAQRPPADYSTQQGWVLIALQNAFYQLLHAPNLEEGVVRTVTAGGDTDTNAAIAGALLGAAYGREAIPLQWRQMVLTCRPLDGSRGVHRPRPRAFWPVDALELGERLLLASGMASTSDQELMSGRV